MRTAVVNRTQLIRDPYGMSFWNQPRRLSSDPSVPPGCPYEWCGPSGNFDIGERPMAANKPAPVGVRLLWEISGWAVAAAGTMNALQARSIRYGSLYNNNPPNGYLNLNVIQGSISLAPDQYQTWKPFTFVGTGTIPVGSDPQTTVNFGSSGWFLAAVQLTILGSAA